MSDTQAHATDETLGRGQAVDETLRRKFETAWVQGSAPAIEQYLPAEDAPSFLLTLAELVHIDLEFAWKAFSRLRHQATTLVPGQHQQRPDPLEDYLARFEGLRHAGILLGLIQQEYALRQRFDDTPSLEEYRKRFPQLNLTMEALAADYADQALGERRQAGATQPSAETALGSFGEYELLEELGRGGMGIVFRAHHPVTDRTVALKVIRRDRLHNMPSGSHSGILERFRNEVQAAARLDHDNIVTVYDVGEVDGDQYYAMRYVRGSSLAEFVRQGPIPHRQAAQYLEGVARALQTAHQDGVLHRDLKPQNILVDDKTGRAMVTDFGLAKLQEAGEELTRAGDVVGTPSYMAPEQARDAAHVTAAADIYGVGATLYQLLTGRPPFQAATPVETLRQVMDEEPVPPSRLNPAIDRDLETICLKCLHKEPARRYQTAAALAEDFGRYLRGEPIEARPLSVVQRGARWCRRNPLLSATAATATACLAIALAASVIGYLKTSAALAKSEENYRLAQSALQDAEQSYQLARNTIDDLYTQVSENDLLNVPGMQQLRHDLLNRALTHYQDFVARRADDERLLHETGLAQFRMARITDELDSPAAALPLYEKALQIQRKLVTEKPDNPASLQELATTLNAMGATYRKAERLDKAMAAFDEAHTLRQQL
ncbi:MAG: serine/threonine-protein kinase, partial [Planctomycetota bacterium]|nr:serine/threonine-protein kinase [Planctomycetota bacterium]